MEELEFIKIGKKEYASLKRDSSTLSALEAGGVDNWEWYHKSLEQAGLLEDD